MGPKTSVALLARLIEMGSVLFRKFVKSIEETRKHRALIEIQLYRGRYKHWSKNDDDLPIVQWDPQSNQRYKSFSLMEKYRERE
jgi:hypothetical protein